MENLYTSPAIVKGGSTKSYTSSHLTEELQDLGSNKKT
jgi:hypothetical protein